MHCAKRLVARSPRFTSLKCKKNDFNFIVLSRTNCFNTSLRCDSGVTLRRRRSRVMITKWPTQTKRSGQLWSPPASPSADLFIPSASAAPAESQPLTDVGCVGCPVKCYEKRQPREPRPNMSFCLNSPACCRPPLVIYRARLPSCGHLVEEQLLPAARRLPLERLGSFEEQQWSQ